MKTGNIILTLIVAGVAGASSYLAWSSGWLAPAPAETDEHGHAGHAEHGPGEPGGEPERGPHGGRLLESGDFAIELTIFEDGLPPQYRVYAYHDGVPVPPAEVQLQIELARLGGRTDLITFSPEGDYLRGNEVVEEPHSFDVKVSGQWADHALNFEFESHEGRVEWTPEMAKFAQIQTAVAGPARLRTKVALPGEVKLNADAMVHIVPRVSGIAREVHKNLGDTVARGDLLAVLDSRELADARSTYLATFERHSLAQKRHAREKDLHERKVSSSEDFLSAESALAEARIDMQSARQKLSALGANPETLDPSEGGLTTYEIRSPIDGVILEKHLNVGEAVAESSGLFVIADLSTVWVEVTVYAQDLGRVREGSPVSIRSEEIGQSAEGTLSYIGSLIGVESRSAKAVVKLPNPDRLWRPGLFVTAEVIDKEFDVPVAISEEALQAFRDWNVVFGKFGDVYEIRPVELGRRAGGWAEVISGLEAGQEYVTTNSYVIKADIEKSGATHDH